MTDSRNGFVRFWKGFWSIISWVRIITLNLIFLALVLLVFSAIFRSADFQLPESGPLVLIPSGYLVDQKSYQSPTLTLMGASSEYPSETLVRDLVDAVMAGAADTRITALVLELDHLMGAELSKLEEVGQALIAFKESGKPIIAVANNYSQSQYYLASFADEIYLNEMGTVLITGFSFYQHYFNETLEKLDIGIHVFRTGEFKDAVEPLIRNDMSDASRAHNSRWINELWNAYTRQVESSRGLPAGALDQFVNNMDSLLQEQGGNGAALALEQGLVDQVLPRVAIRAKLQERFGADETGESYVALPHHPYLNQHRLLQPPKTDQIGLIVAAGTILDGEQPTGSIGSETLSRLIRQARHDDTIKAVVLRVDSGGGSAFASEEIRQELAATRASGKPVIVSMGSVAASGGYWISLPADEVWAMPTTITGSIGVFGVFPNIEQSLAKIGIHVDGIATTDLAGGDRIDRPLSPKVEAITQSSVEFIYQRFLQLVSDARNQTPDAIHELAQGRVWSGSAAAELGLVDKLGYLRDALAAAANAAGLDDFGVALVEPELTPTEQIMRALSSEAQSWAGYIKSQLLVSLIGSPSAGNLLEEAVGPSNADVPWLNSRANGVYAQCLACGRL